MRTCDRAHTPRWLQLSLAPPPRELPGMSPPPGGLRLNYVEGVLNMFKASLGPGCLSLPFAVSRVGLLLAPFEMIVLMACCVYNMHLMVTVKQNLAARPGLSGPVNTYGDCGEAVFGPKYGRRLIEFFVTLQQLGVPLPIPTNSTCPLPAASTAAQPRRLTGRALQESARCTSRSCRPTSTPSCTPPPGVMIDRRLPLCVPARWWPSRLSGGGAGPTFTSQTS